MGAAPIHLGELGHQHGAESEHGERRDEAHCRDGCGGLADVGRRERSGGDRPVDEPESRGDDRRRHQGGGTAQQEAELAPMLGLSVGLSVGAVVVRSACAAHLLGETS